MRPEDCYVVGDAVWDLLGARRAGMLSVGLLSGGYGADESSRAGAFRVYAYLLELHRSLDEPRAALRLPALLELPFLPPRVEGGHVARDAHAEIAGGAFP